MRTMIFGAGTDLGVHIDGASLGPLQLMNDIKPIYQGESMLFSQDPNIIKSRNLSDRRKNEYEIEKFNSTLYKAMVEKIKEKYFPIMIGGDHSAGIPSALASAKVNIDIGMIWIDAHSDYHNMESTISGNIHGMPLCSITGENGTDLNEFFDGEYISPENAFIIGGRDIEDPERINYENAGVRLFTTEDIKKNGVKRVMDYAFSALSNTDGIHISYDLDVIDPLVAPGVSVPAVNGINEEEAYEIMDSIIEHIDRIKSFDLVELNPDRDIDDKTKKIALNLLNKLIDKLKGVNQ